MAARETKRKSDKCLSTEEKKVVFEKNAKMSKTQDWIEDTQNCNKSDSKDLIIIESDEEDMKAAYNTIIIRSKENQNFSQ